MPKFCANLNWLFQELPLEERFEAAKETGFDAVEMLNPYEGNAQDIVNVLAKHFLHMALINCPPPNYTGGDPGYAAVPGSRFKTDFKRSLRYAETLGAEHIHIMSGVAEGREAHETFVENLRWAAVEAPAQSLTIEPINTHDMPGYFLCDFEQALQIVEEVNAPNLNFQFDVYHAQKIHGDVLKTWAHVKKRVVHVQVAQPPQRSEPDQSEIDYSAFFQQLDADGYDGWISGEYRPKTTTVDGLGWLLKYS